jgi:hypothetical protein
MKGLIQVESRALVSSNTPTLQHSNTPIPLSIFTGKAIELPPGPQDQVF